MKQALIVLDVQRIYTDRGSELFCKDTAKTIKNINKLVSEMSNSGQPVVLVRHIHKADGSDLGRLFEFTGEPEDDFNFKEGSEEVEFDDRLSRQSNAVELIKNRYSAFAKTNLDPILRQNGVERVVICGFMTNFCCESTARDALDRDFLVDFVLDATGTPGTENLDQDKVREVVGDLLQAGFARVMSTDQILAEWKRE